MNAVQKWLSVLLCSALVACGGGGGGSAEAPTTAKPLSVDPAVAVATSNATLDAEGASFKLAAAQSESAVSMPAAAAANPTTGPAGAASAADPATVTAAAPAASTPLAATTAPAATTTPPTASAGLVPANTAVAAPVAVAAQPAVAQVVQLIKVGEFRRDRTVYDYTFKVVLRSPDKSLAQADARVLAVGDGTTVISGSAIFDEVAAGVEVTSKNTITLRHDRTKPFKANAVRWAVATYTPLTRPAIEAVATRAVVNPAVLTGDGVVVADARNPLLLADPTGSFGAVGTLMFFDGTVRRVLAVQTNAQDVRQLVTEELPLTAAFSDLAITTTVNPLAALATLSPGATVQGGPDTLGRKFTQAVRRIWANDALPTPLDFKQLNRFDCITPKPVLEREDGEATMRWEIGCSTQAIGAAFGKQWPNLGTLSGHFQHSSKATYTLDPGQRDDYTLTRSTTEWAGSFKLEASSGNVLPEFEDADGNFCRKSKLKTICEVWLFKQPLLSASLYVAVPGVPVAVPVVIEVKPRLTLEFKGEGEIAAFHISTRQTVTGVRAGNRLPAPSAADFGAGEATFVKDVSKGAKATTSFSAESQLLIAATADIGRLKHVPKASLASIEVGAGVYAQGQFDTELNAESCFHAGVGAIASLKIGLLESDVLKNAGLFGGFKVDLAEERWPWGDGYSNPPGCKDAVDSSRLRFDSRSYAIVGANNYQSDPAGSSLGRDVYAASGDWLLKKKAAGLSFEINFSKLFTDNAGIRGFTLEEPEIDAVGVAGVSGRMDIVRDDNGKITSARYHISPGQLKPGDRILVTAAVFQDLAGKRESSRVTRMIRINFDEIPEVTATYEFVRLPSGRSHFELNVVYPDAKTWRKVTSARVLRGSAGPDELASQEPLGREYQDLGGPALEWLVQNQRSLSTLTSGADNDEAQRPKWLLVETTTTEGIDAVYRIPISADTAARVSTVAFANKGSGRFYTGEEVLDPLSELKVLVHGHNLPAELPLEMSWCSRLVETVTDVEMFRVGARSTVEREFTCTIARAGQGLQTTVLGFVAQPQSVAQLTGLPLRGPQTVTQGEVSDFSLLAARFTDYARNLVTVFWNFGGEVVREVQGLAQQVSHAFATAGDKIISVVYQVLGERLGSEPGSVVQVQPGSGISVTKVTPLTAIAGVAQTFDVSGANMPMGLVFTLEGCDNPVEVAVGTNPSLRRFTCTFAATAAERSYDGSVASGSSIFSPAPFFEFKVSVSRVALNPVQPAQTMRSIATSFEFTGQNLPTTGLSVVPVGNDRRSNCQVPNNLTANGFGVACELFKVGAQVLEVRHGNQVLGTSTVTVASNVTGVTWTSPSTANSGTVKFGETVTFAVRGENLTTDVEMGFAVEKCGVSNEEVGVKTATQRTFTCFFNNQAGAVAGQMPGVVKDEPGGQVLFDGWKVPVEVPVAAGSSDTLEGAFSNNPTPSAPWSFGWQATNGAAPTPYGKFTAAGSRTDYPTLAIWNKSEGTGPTSDYPYVYKNTGTASVFYRADVTDFPAQSVIVTPGSARERAVFRWTAPAAGTYEINAWFELMQGGSVDVRVQKNGTDLFVTQIAGKGSVATAPVQTVVLAAGDAIDFAVGDGGNTNHSDITRVSGAVKAVGNEPPPAAIHNLFLGLPVATSTLCGLDCLGTNATDGSLLTAANLLTYSGNFVVQSAGALTLGAVRLIPDMSPNGEVSLEIRTHTDPTVGTGGSGWVTRYAGVVHMARLEPRSFNFLEPALGVRQVEVRVFSSPSWVAFFEIEGYREPLEGTISVSATTPIGATFVVPAGVTTCDLQAAGQWRWGQNSYADASGVSDAVFSTPDWAKIDPAAPWFSLVAKSGGNYRYIGLANAMAVVPGQTIQFMINEGVSISAATAGLNVYADNADALSVTYSCR